jgi:hypothetical protein
VVAKLLTEMNRKEQICRAGELEIYRDAIDDLQWKSLHEKPEMSTIFGLAVLSAERCTLVKGLSVPSQLIFCNAVTYLNRRRRGERVLSPGRQF